MLVGVYFAISGNATIVTMLLIGYSCVTQLFPTVIASPIPRNPTTPAGAFAGILVGVVVAAILNLHARHDRPVVPGPAGGRPRS
jgi:solute:Na+ symporter, SSS family